MPVSWSRWQPPHEASAADDGATESSDPASGFTRWRQQRPFGAGLLMIMAGAVILTPAYLSLEVSNIQVQISTISGVSTLLIGALLIVCGLLTWSKGDARILTGVTAMILAIIALPTSNFGGFIIGTLFALLGGAWALSWTPDEKIANANGRKSRHVPLSGKEVT